MELGVGLVAGFFLGVAADIVRQWLDRKTRQEERSEKAAQDLVPLLDEAREPFKEAFRIDADVDDAHVRERVTKLRQKSLLLADPEAQKRVELVAEVLEGYHGAQVFTGDTPYRIAWVAWDEGRQALRRILAGKPLDEPSEQLLRYKSSIDEDHQLWEQNMREEAERRRRNRRSSSDGGGDE